jgi:hypothetical protein
VVFDGKFFFYIKNSNSQSLPIIGTMPQKSFGTYFCKTGGFSRLTSRAQRKKIYCRPHSCMNASVSRARTGFHSHRHPGQGDEPQRLGEVANVKFVWIQCEKDVQVHQ